MASGRHQTNIHIEGDHEVAVHVNQAGERWFKLFHAVVESGLWAEIPLAAAKVLVVLAKHADERWIAWPSTRVIAQLAGLTERGTYKAIGWLEDNRLIVRRTRGGGARSTSYELVAPPLHRGSGVNRGSGVDPCTGVQGTPEPGFRRSRLNEQDLNNNRAAPQHGAQNGATAPSPDVAVVDALTDAEIAEPTRSQLASLAHITPALVRRVAEKTREKGGGVGATVNGIRAACEKAARDAELKRARRLAERAVQAELLAQQERERAEVATGEERQAALDQMADILGRRREE